MSRHIVHDRIIFAECITFDLRNTFNSLSRLKRKNWLSNF